MTVSLLFGRRCHEHKGILLTYIRSPTPGNTKYFLEVHVMNNCTAWMTLVSMQISLFYSADYDGRIQELMQEVRVHRISLVKPACMHRFALTGTQKTFKSTTTLCSALQWWWCVVKEQCFCGYTSEEAYAHPYCRTLWLAIDPVAMKSDDTWEVDKNWVRNASRHSLATLHWQDWNPQNGKISMVSGLKSLILGLCFVRTRKLIQNKTDSLLYIKFQTLTFSIWKGALQFQLRKII